ncbi:MAG: formylglycine-generating enzyme family protein [Rhodospirillales bacterium]
MFHKVLERISQPKHSLSATLVAWAIPFALLAIYWIWYTTPPALTDPNNFRDCDECPEMTVIPPGKFLMGSPPWEEGRFRDEGPVHLVTIDYPFAVSIFEITNREWSAITGVRRGFGPDPDEPVSGVSWVEANEFVLLLRERTGKEYRLLSESEWEYMARAGTTGPFHFGEISVEKANYDGNSYMGSPTASPIIDDYFAEGDTYPPNAFGVYNVHGNVAEIVADCYSTNYEGAPTDGSPRTWPGCDWRVLRGGYASFSPAQIRSAKRAYYSGRLGTAGLRVARDID